MRPADHDDLAVTAWANGIASAGRVNEVLETVPEVQDHPRQTPPQSETWPVVFENVSFAYNGSCNEPVLRDVNLMAEPGETVAILGATGSGKRAW